MNQAIQQILAQLMAGGGKAVKGVTDSAADMATKGVPTATVDSLTYPIIRGGSEEDASGPDSVLSRGAALNAGVSDPKQLSPEDIQAFAEAAAQAKAKDGEGVQGAWNPVEFLATLGVGGGAHGLLAGLGNMGSDIASFHGGEAAAEYIKHLLSGGHERSQPSMDDIIAALGSKQGQMVAEK